MQLSSFVMISFDSNRPDFAAYGLTCVRWSPTRMRRPDRHNEIELNYLTTGWVTYLLGGRNVRVEAGHLAAFWAAIPHQILDYGDASDYFVVTIPLAWFLQCKLPRRFVQALLQGELIYGPSSSSARPDALMFADWVKDLQESNSELNRAVMLELEARLLRLTLACPDRMSASPRSKRRAAPLPSSGLNKVEQMACFIAQRYTERLRTEVIARAVHLHPNYAMSLFQKAFGSTLVEYITRHRVSHAQRLLVTTDMKIVDIAEASGFASISRFNSAFRRGCGCSPREYRQHHSISDSREARPVAASSTG